MFPIRFSVSAEKVGSTAFQPETDTVSTESNIFEAHLLDRGQPILKHYCNILRKSLVHSVRVLCIYFEHFFRRSVNWKAKSNFGRAVLQRPWSDARPERSLTGLLADDVGNLPRALSLASLPRHSPRSATALQAIRAPRLPVTRHDAQAGDVYSE